ncbi:YfiR family protein [Aquabacterium sp.]|uniref:YfiR family protein n=1 Tax=Aquabacterium sp. TaxID=1872578 RepID=UPI002C5D17EE|nr:YfiR family protein [Aquabacterium sp.]HSW04055.1 YfiR family protein [Aquabacterium sp.]
MLRWAHLVVLLLLLGLPLRSLALDELPLKAAIIFNLLLFVEWPGEAELPSGAPLLLCADRSSPLWPHLKLLQDRPVRQRRLEAREVASTDEQRACHAWVLDDAGQRPLAARVAGAGPTLVIGDGQRADEAGVTIGLRMNGSRLQFDIDMVQARQQRLQLSSKILRLARKVRE